MGEFSFILGTVARQLGLLDDAGWNALVAVSIISIALNPTLYRAARRRSLSAPKLDPSVDRTPAIVDPNRCILVGHGPVGNIVYRLLTERGAEVTVIDLNLDAVRRMKSEGLTAVYGDVLRSGTLEEAGIARVGSLILSADLEDAAEVIRQARHLNPQLRVLARCAHLRDVANLRRAGAVVVAAGEAEVGVALAEAVLAGDAKTCGELAEQRDAVRARLYETSRIV